MPGMNNRAFEEAFAEVAKTNLTRARQLCRIYRALIIAGVHAHGTVTIDGMGVYSNRWWTPRGKLVGSGMQPSNRLRFKPSKLLLSRMAKWAGAPGLSRKARNITRAGHPRVEQDQPIQESTPCKPPQP